MQAANNGFAPAGGEIGAAWWKRRPHGISIVAPDRLTYS